MRNISLSPKPLPLLVLMLLTCRHELSTGALALTPHLTWIIHDCHHHVGPLIQNAASTVSQHPLHISATATTSTNLASATVSSSPLHFIHPQEYVASLYAKYKQALDAKPLQTKIMTGCTVAVVGDAIAQSKEPLNYDWKRAVSFVAFDGCWRAVQVITYKPLIETFSGQFSKSLLNHLLLDSSQQDVLQQVNPHLLGAMEQTLVSQLVLIPLIYYPLFFATTGLVQGLTIKETLIRARETFLPLMKRNLMFWIPTQFAVFGFIEENLQIPILIVCGLIWTIILSLSAGNANEEHQPSEFDLSDGVFVESSMAELGAVETAMGLNGTSFYYAANISAYVDEQEDDDEAIYESIRTFNPSSPASNELSVQEQAVRK